MPSQAQDAVTMLLMQSLTQQGAGMTPGADPFALEPATEAMTPASGQNQTPVPAAQRLAKGLGVDVSELEQPASGPMAEALGVEGVEPDFDQAEKLIKLMQMSRQMGMQEALGQQGGGPPPADPTLRNALTYQAIQNSVQRFGPGHAGGQILNALSPLLAPYMMGPALERQRAEAAQAAQAKNLIELEKTRSLGAKRQADIELAKARTEKIKAETKIVGKGKDKVTLRTVEGGIAKFDAAGNMIGFDEFSAKEDEPFPVKDVTDADGNKVDQMYASKIAYLRGDPPMREQRRYVAGSAGERKTLAELYASIIKAKDFVLTNYDDRFVGPIVGRAMEGAKAGDPISQYLGNKYITSRFNEADLRKLIDFHGHLNQLNSDLIFYYSKSQVPAGEQYMRNKQLAKGTDFPLLWGGSFRAVVGHLETVTDQLQKQRGINVRNLEDEKPPAPHSSGFSGAPTTKVPGQLQDRRMEEFWKQNGLD